MAFCSNDGCDQFAKYQCKRCHALYCGLECQKADWPIHRITCKLHALSIGLPPNDPKRRARARASDIETDTDMETVPKPVFEREVDLSNSDTDSENDDDARRRKQQPQQNVQIEPKSTTPAVYRDRAKIKPKVYIDWDPQNEDRKLPTIVNVKRTVAEFYYTYLAMATREDFRRIRRNSEFNCLSLKEKLEWIKKERDKIHSIWGRWPERPKRLEHMSNEEYLLEIISETYFAYLRTGRDLLTTYWKWYPNLSPSGKNLDAKNK